MAVKEYDFTVQWNGETEFFEAVGRPKDDDNSKLIVAMTGKDLAQLKLDIEQMAKDALDTYQKPDTWSKTIDTLTP